MFDCGYAQVKDKPLFNKGSNFYTLALARLIVVLLNHILVHRRLSKLVERHLLSGKQFALELSVCLFQVLSPRARVLALGGMEGANHKVAKASTITFGEIILPTARLLKVCDGRQLCVQRLGRVKAVVERIDGALRILLLGKSAVHV